MDCQKKLEFICYICGLYTPKTPKAIRQPLTPNLKQGYFKSFGIEVNVFDYTPNFVCRNCYNAVTEKRTHRNLPQSPMIWNKPNTEHTDCYACMCPSFLEKNGRIERRTSSTPNIQHPVREHLSFRTNGTDHQ